MNKKKLLGVVVLITFAVLINVYIIHVANRREGDWVVFHAVVKTDQIAEYQVYPGSADWVEQDSVKVTYKKVNEMQDLAFQIPCTVQNLRFDLGNTIGRHIIQDIYISYKKKQWKLDMEEVASQMMQPGIANDIQEYFAQEDGLCIQTNGNDGYIVLSLPRVNAQVVEMRHHTLLLRYGLVCVLVNIFIIILLVRFNWCYEFIKGIFYNRKLIYKLAKNDFKTKYAGSFFGIFWAFVQPVITILLYWFVFEIGFDSKGVANCPFVLWLISGLVPWFFFSDAWNGGTSSLLEYSYLVKKVVFEISVLPIVKVTASIFVSIFFHGIMFLLFILYGIVPDVYNLQLIYYAICLFALSLSLTYITCSMIPFFRDLGQIMNILLQVLIWMTPIMWNKTMMPQQLRWILKLNPMFYIVQGYRDAVIEKAWFWDDITWTVYFWALVGALFVLGNVLFKKMRPHFSDVL